MMLWQHFLASALLAAALYPLTGNAAFLVFIGGFLIDIDHIIYYLFRFRSFGVKKVYEYCLSIGRERKFEEHMRMVKCFHFIEIPLLLFFLGFIDVAFLVASAGFVLHLTMDIVYEKRLMGKAIMHSIILLIFRNSQTKSLLKRQ
ncbi:hypothetical protein J4401_00790 [Candidatus Woesearchaeota archaeon]|nr:hypothetical protein [Candidatus Woesearchaeota archaeon]